MRDKEKMRCREGPHPSQRGLDGDANLMLQPLSLPLSEERRDGAAQSPKREIRGIGAGRNRAPGCHQGNRSRLGCGSSPATNAIAGIDGIGIQGDGGIQGYCPATINVGARIQRDALVCDNAPIEVSGCPQRRRTANLPENLVITPRIDDIHHRGACRCQGTSNLEDDHLIAQALEIQGERSGQLC